MMGDQLEELKRNKQFYIYHSCHIAIEQRTIGKSERDKNNDRQRRVETDREIAAQGRARNEFAFTLIDGFRWPFSRPCGATKITKTND